MKKQVLLTIVIFVLSFIGVFAQNQPVIHGRIQFDVEAMKHDNDTSWVVGNEFRRVHLSVGGRIDKRFRYKMEVNIAHGKIGFRDMYLQFLTGKWGVWGIGSMAEPTGLAMATSSKYIPFLERPTLTALQNFRWGTGLHFAHNSLLNDHLGIQMSLTGNGKNGEGFLDKHLERGLNFATRVFGFFPLKSNKSNGVHLGVNAASRPPADLHFRAENHLGKKYVYVFPGAKRRMIWGGEMALMLGSFSLRSEYKIQRMPVASGDPYQMKAYYATVGYLLTGEAYPYKKGAFTRIRPAHPVTEKDGWGAWEVLARFSQIEANLPVRSINANMPGQVSTFSLGLNWYPHAHIRLMYNYNITTDHLAKGKLHAHLFRVQVDF